MAWDDSPPTQQELNFSPRPAAWDSTPPTPEEIRFASLQPSTNTQRAGFVPTMEDVKSFLPSKRDVLPGIGMGVGASYAGIPGAALGQSAGESFNQLIERTNLGKKLLGEEPPKTSLEAAKRIGLEGIRGALAQSLGKYVVNPIMGKFGKWLFPGAKQATQQAVKTAEEEGIKALPSMISPSKAVAGTERVLEYSPFGAAITEARKKTLDDFGSYAERVGESISPDKLPEINGALVKEAAKGYYDAFNDVKTKLYNSFMPKIGDNPVNVQPVIDELQNMIAIAKNRGENGIASYAQGILDKITNLSELPTTQTMPGMTSMSHPLPTFSKIKDIGTGIGIRAKFFDPSNPGMQGSLKKLWGIVQDVLDETAEKTGDESIVSALNQAKEYNHIGKSVLGSNVYKALIVAPQGNEYKIAFNPNDPSTYETVKEVVGKDMMGGLSRQWFDDLLKKSSKDNVLSPQILLNNLDKASPVLERMTEDFPQASTQINRLRDVARLLVKNSDVMRGSQTAPLGAMIGTMMEIAYNIPKMFVSPASGAAGVAAGIGILGASKVGTSAVTSDWLRNLLSKGYPSIQPGIEKGLSPLSIPSTYLGVKGSSEYAKKRLGLADGVK